MTDSTTPATQHTTARYFLEGLQETGIRWGLDDGYPERFDLPRLSGNSWLFGLRRMLLGFAMGDGEPVAGILPYAGIEGQQGLALGKLAWFVDSLAEFLPRLQQAQPLTEWHACLLALLERFYLADEEEERLLQLIRSQLADWQTQLGEARFDQPITADLLQDYLGKVLGESRSSQRFSARCSSRSSRSCAARASASARMARSVCPCTA